MNWTYKPFVEFKYLNSNPRGFIFDIFSIRCSLIYANSLLFRNTSNLCFIGTGFQRVDAGASTSDIYPPPPASKLTTLRRNWIAARRRSGGWLNERASQWTNEWMKGHWLVNAAVLPVLDEGAAVIGVKRKQPRCLMSLPASITASSIPSDPIGSRLIPPDDIRTASTCKLPFPIDWAIFPPTIFNRKIAFNNFISNDFQLQIL